MPTTTLSAESTLSDLQTFFAKEKVRSVRLITTESREIRLEVLFWKPRGPSKTLRVVFDGAEVTEVFARLSQYCTKGEG